MPHRTYVSEDSTYVIQEVTGDITRETQLKTIIEAHELGKKLGINKYLVDITGARNISTAAENYDFAYSDLRKTPEVMKGTLNAIVVSPDDHSHDFVEVLLSNSGRIAKFFRNKNEAIAFLASK